MALKRPARAARDSATSAESPDRVPRVSKGWPGRGLEMAGDGEPFQESDAERHLSRIETSRLQLFPNTPEGHYAEITCALPSVCIGFVHNPCPARAFLQSIIPPYVST